MESARKRLENYDISAQQIRELEHEMLKYVEKAGPPKERAPLEPSQQPGGGGSRR